MNYLDLVERVSELPNVGKDFCHYLITRSTLADPSTSFISLIPTSGGTWQATFGDLREKTEPALDAQGERLVFEDEDSACRWALDKITAARSFPPESAADREAALSDARTIHRRIEELDSRS